jgi:hypothetical protein
MIGPFIDMHGAVDVHVHSEPDLFPRIADDVGVARHAADMGLRAIVLKCHSERTVSRAFLTRKLVPGIEVHGGIVLNRAVGGINPAAAEAALLLGAKQVWMPTVDAAHHAATFGSTGAYDKQASTVAREGEAGITILDDSDHLVSEVYDVIDLVARHRAILGTCHLSPAEIYALVPAALERGVEKVLITHPFFKVPGFQREDVEHFTGLGAFAEFGYCTVSPMWNHAPLSRVADAIKTVGVERCILMSDGGQRHNPMPAECLRVFAQSLFESGLSEEEIDRLIKVNPADLLELSEEPAPTPAQEGDGRAATGEQAMISPVEA